jgi:hypothetical protein
MAWKGACEASLNEFHEEFHGIKFDDTSKRENEFYEM